MWELTANGLFEDEGDDFFADAFRSISEIESSATSSKNSNENFGVKNDNSQHSNSSPIEVNSHCKTVDSNKNNLSIISDCIKIDKVEIVSKCENSINSEANLNSFKNEACSAASHRFSPGFTLKAQKRKFSGPAGSLEDKCANELSIANVEPLSKRLSRDETDVQSFASSQSSVEELLQSVSWQKLQEEVSSNTIMLSNAKNFSIQQVLCDTAKKKLPKHIIVPILCLYIKKFNEEEPISIYVDDTGEINGKISKEIIESYRESFKSGTSLVLKNVPFVCNVMLLEKSNLVSLYLEDKSVIHVQDWNSLANQEPLKPLNCIFPVTPKLKETEKKAENVINKTASLQYPDILNKNLFSVQHSSNKTQSFSPKNIVNNCLNSPTKTHISSDPDLENEAMDEFDELLGNLDETSFLEDF